MIERTVKILSEDGLHARPAGLFVKKANEFKSKIEVKANGNTKNGKSILSLMSLGLKSQADLTILIDGEDEQEAMTALTDFINNPEK